MRLEELTQGGSVGGPSPGVLQHEEWGSRRKSQQRKLTRGVSEVGENQESCIQKSKWKGEKSLKDQGETSHVK